MDHDVYVILKHEVHNDEFGKTDTTLDSIWTTKDAAAKRIEELAKLEWNDYMCQVEMNIGPELATINEGGCIEVDIVMVRTHLNKVGLF